MESKSSITSVVRVMWSGIALWVIAAVVALITGADSKVLWTCAVGIALGLYGLRYSTRRDNRGEL